MRLGRLLAEETGPLFREHVDFLVQRRTAGLDTSYPIITVCA